MSAYADDELYSGLDDAELKTRLESAPDGDARYQLALEAMRRGQTGAARVALERLVGERPRFAGAWLDLALASYRDGDKVAAVEHLEYLRQRFQLPPALAEQVAYWLELWQTPGAKRVQPEAWRSEWLVGFGHDSNANAGPSSSALSLTLPGGVVVLPVDEHYRPHADNFTVINGVLRSPNRSLAGGWASVVVSARTRLYASQTDFSSADIQAGLEYLSPVSQTGGWRATAFVQHYHLGRNSLYDGLRLGLQRIGDFGGCQLTGGGEIEGRWYGRYTVLGGDFAWLTGGIGCRLGPGKATLLARHGQEAAHGARVGGNNTQSEVYLHYLLPLGSGGRLETAWQGTRISDRQGYNIILNGGVPRRILRQTLSATLARPLAAGWELSANVEIQRQESSLQLFQQSRTTVMFGLGRRF